MATYTRAGHVRWPKCTFVQAERRYYSLVSKRFGVSRRAADHIAVGPYRGAAQATTQQPANTGVLPAAAPGHGRGPVSDSVGYRNALRINTVTATLSTTHLSQQPEDRSLPKKSESQRLQQDDMTP